MSIYIPVSSISSITNRNKYKTKEQSFVDILNKYNKDIYDILIKNYKSKTNTIVNIQEKFPDFIIDDNLSHENNVELALQIPEIEKEFSFTTEDIEEKTSLDKISKLEDFNDIIKIEKIKDSDVKILYDKIEVPKERIENIINKNRGIILEQSTILKLKKEFKFKITTNPENCYIKKYFKLYKINPFKDNIDCDYTISGRVDGIILRKLVDGVYENTRCIIEIKNRRNNFFIPGYDLDQLAMYIILYGDYFSGFLVQQFNGDINLDIERDYEWAYDRYSKIKPILDNSVKWMKKIIDNPESDESFEFTKNHIIKK